MISSLRALRNSNYRHYFIGQFVSMAGSWMQVMVQGWLMYRLTGSAAWLGAVTFATQISSFIAAPWAGLVADQFDRRKILLATEYVAMAQAFAMAALVYSGSVQPWQIVALATVLGLTNAFEINTRHAFAMDVVGRENLSSAIALNAAVINGSRLIGPAFGGILLPLIGEAGCFAVNGASFLAVVIGLLSMQLPARPRPQSLNFRVLSRLASTISYISAHRGIRRLVLFALFISFAGLPYGTLLPVFAKDVLQGDAKVLAWLMGMSGAGAMVGAVFIGGARTESAHVERRILLYTIFTGLFLALLALSTLPWLSYVAAFGVGAFMMSMFPQINSAIQMEVDDSIRGQVLSVYSMTFFGATPIGSFLAGWFTDWFGVQRVTLVCGLACLAYVLVVYCKSRLEPVGSRKI